MNARRHFVLLAAAIALWVPISLVLGWSGLMPHLFGLAGLMHAGTVALSIDSQRLVGDRVVFVFTTGLVAIVVPYLGMVLGIFGGFIVVPIVASAAGAAAYWWLIRAILSASLPKAVLKRALIACPLATVVGGFITQATQVDAFTPLWWLAFSLSLHSGVRSMVAANSGMQPTGQERPAADAGR